MKIRKEKSIKKSQRKNYTKKRKEKNNWKKRTWKIKKKIAREKQFRNRAES